jgi:hypothetical protein
VQAPLIPTDPPELRRGLAVSVLLHAVFLAIGLTVLRPPSMSRTELVDIEVAPPPPPVEALPEEVARTPEESPPPKDEEATASTAPEEPGEGFAIDAGVDGPIDAAPIDAPIDAPVDAPIDAPIDAPTADAGAPDAAEPMVAAADAGATEDAEQIAATDLPSGTGSGSSAGSGAFTQTGPASIAEQPGAGSGSAGAKNEPAVDGAPTTAGTAANLLTYFPKGHVVTVLIRFDRLRGTEWAPQTERLLQPMPDYRVLFGGKAAKIVEKLELLVISTPSPRDVIATTLVGRTRLGRAGLREMLAAAAPVEWSVAKGGLIGKRSRVVRGDQRVFLSPFQGWFLLAQPTDLGALTQPAAGNLDTATASLPALPQWLKGIRTIAAESGEEARGPALVLTIELGGKRVDLGDSDFGLGIQAIPTPDRVSLAMELVKQGWLVRGNMSFGKERDAIEFISAAEAVRDRVGDSTAIQMVLGKPLTRVVKNLSFLRAKGRVSYATSISIADARAILAVTAQQLDAYFRQ